MSRPAPPVQSQMLAHALPMMSAQMRAWVAEAHAFYVRQFKGKRDSPEQKELAAGINAAVDQAVAHAMQLSPDSLRITCTRGCSHCCKTNVTVTRAEAHLLLTYAGHQGVAVDWERVRRQSAHAGPVRWKVQPVEDRACVFLDAASGECRVYEHRPTGCRKYFVITPPGDCDNIAHPGGRVLHFVAQEAELIYSAALTALPGASMPIMLLAAQREGAAAP